jgi:hypothetical protein
VYPSPPRFPVRYSTQAASSHNHRHHRAADHCSRRHLGKHNDDVSIADGTQSVRDDNRRVRGVGPMNQAIERRLHSHTTRSGTRHYTSRTSTLAHIPAQWLRSGCPTQTWPRQAAECEAGARSRVQSQCAASGRPTTARRGHQPARNHVRQMRGL